MTIETDTEICVDPGSEIITAVMATMRDVFDPDSPCPPDGGGSKNVRFFAGDATPLAAWDAHTSGGDDCGQPFLWVRVMQRYRALGHLRVGQSFPVAGVDGSLCGQPRILSIEVGVGRCAVVDLNPSWDDYAREAEVGLDDSWRLELAMCRIKRRLELDHIVGIDVLKPYGPEGGVIAWTGIVHIEF